MFSDCDLSTDTSVSSIPSGKTSSSVSLMTQICASSGLCIVSIASNAKPSSSEVVSSLRVGKRECASAV